MGALGPSNATAPRGRDVLRHLLGRVSREAANVERTNPGRCLAISRGSQRVSHAIPPTDDRPSASSA